MRTVLAATIGVSLAAATAIGQAPLAKDIENTSGKYLVWGDYKIELNQYGGLGDSVASPWIPAPAEDNAKLDNDLDDNWKSMAWLRVPGRKGPEKDLVLVRFDVAEPLLHLMKTKGRPAAESIAGWLLVEHKLAYAVLVDLDLDLEKPPETPVGLLRGQPE